MEMKITPYLDWMLRFRLDGVTEDASRPSVTPFDSWDDCYPESDIPIGLSPQTVSVYGEVFRDVYNRIQNGCPRYDLELAVKVAKASQVTFGEKIEFSPDSGIIGVLIGVVLNGFDAFFDHFYQRDIDKKDPFDMAFFNKEIVYLAKEKPVSGMGVIGMIRDEDLRPEAKQYLDQMK